MQCREGETEWYIKMRIVINLSENGCHFVNLLSFASSTFFLSLRKIMWLNLQQPKTRGHVEHWAPSSDVISLEFFSLKNSIFSHKIKPFFPYFCRDRWPHIYFQHPLWSHFLVPCFMEKKNRWRRWRHRKWRRRNDAASIRNRKSIWLTRFFVRRKIKKDCLSLLL